MRFDAIETLGVSYSVEVARFGTETTIIVPGSYTTGTNHFAHAGRAADTATQDAYEELYTGLLDQVTERLAALTPPDADPEEVAREVVRVVDLPKGSRPFRTVIDPSDDGASVVYAVGDRIRTEFYRRIGLEDLLSPSYGADPTGSANADERLREREADGQTS